MKVFSTYKSANVALPVAKTISTCNTPFLQPISSVTLQVTRKIELSSTLRNVARQVAARDISQQLATQFH